MRNTIRRSIALGMLGMMLCAPASAADLRPVKMIAFINPIPAYPVFQEADKCFRAAITAAGVQGETSGPTGLAFDNQFNLDRMSQYMATGADGIILVPVDGPMYTPIMQQAKAKGIYLAAMNTGNTTTVQDVVLGTDYGNQGKVIAENLAKRAGQQNVIIGNAPSGVHKVFVDGFKAGIAALPNVKLIDEGFDQSDPAQTTDVVSRLLTAHPEVNVVLSWEGTAVAGIVTAIKEKKLVGKVVGVTNDITPEVVAGLK